MRMMEAVLGVPKLGITTETYDFDNPGDCEALDLNIANGCSLLILRAFSPNKGNNMNEATLMADPIVEAEKQYVLTIDPVTGEEVKVELKPIEGEFSQEAEEIIFN